MPKFEVLGAEESEVPARVSRGIGFAALDECHRRVLCRVEELSGLVASIETGEINPAMRALAASVVQFLDSDARRHHEDEERHVFPTLLAGGSAEMVATVLRLQQDHSWIEEDWFELRPHAQAIATGYGTCDIDALREGTAILAALFKEHIALEELIVYPEARARCDAAGLDAMAREMMPGAESNWPDAALVLRSALVGARCCHFLRQPPSVGLDCAPRVVQLQVQVEALFDDLKLPSNAPWQRYAAASMRSRLRSRLTEAATRLQRTRRLNTARSTLPRKLSINVRRRTDARQSLADIWLQKFQHLGTDAWPVLTNKGKTWE